LKEKGKLTTSLFGIFLRRLLVAIISRMRYRWPKMRCSPVWIFIVKRIGLYLHPVNAKRRDPDCFGSGTDINLTSIKSEEANVESKEHKDLEQDKDLEQTTDILCDVCQSPLN
jgi:hypothetical protein